MHQIQVNRLKKDSKELGNYIHKLNKKGRYDLAYKIARKREFLDQHIVEIEQTK